MNEREGREWSVQSRVLGGVNQDLRAGGTPKDPQSTPSATSGPPGLFRGHASYLLLGQGVVSSEETQIIYDN